MAAPVTSSGTETSSAPASAAFAVAAAVVAALVSSVQVVLAERVGITWLDGDFTAGNDRVMGVSVTLVAWFCALAAPVGLAVAGLRWRPSRAVRLAATPLVALAALNAWPLAAARTGDVLRDDIAVAVPAGVVLGGLVALLVAVFPEIGRGIAAHAVLWWLAALPLTLTLWRATAYAGLVEPSARPSGLFFGPLMLAFAASWAVWAVRRGNPRWLAWAAAVAGFLLAEVCYFVVPSRSMLLYNGEAFAVGGLIGLAAMVVAAVAVIATRPRVPAAPQD